MIHQETFRKQLHKTMQEHGTLHESIDELRTFWVEVNEIGYGPKYEEMGIRINEFRKVLTDHFRKEEDQLFKMVVEDCEPIVAEKVKHLCEKHVELLKRLEDDSLQVKWNRVSFANWECVRDELESIMDSLADHEAEEHAILEQLL